MADLPSVFLPGGNCHEGLCVCHICDVYKGFHGVGSSEHHLIGQFSVISDPPKTCNTGFQQPYKISIPIPQSLKLVQLRICQPTNQSDAA